MSKLLEVRTTFATSEDAERIARQLVSEKLAACAQIVPNVTSIYMWESMLRHDSEVLLLLKTTESSWPALRDRLAALHPYDTPELVAVPIENGAFNYINWVKENTR
jgi:periplasmic divalent cation tolerance protein